MSKRLPRIMGILSPRRALLVTRGPVTNEKDRLCGL